MAIGLLQETHSLPHQSKPQPLPCPYLFPPEIGYLGTSIDIALDQSLLWVGVSRKTEMIHLFARIVAKDSEELIVVWFQRFIIVHQMFSKQIVDSRHIGTGDQRRTTFLFLLAKDKTPRSIVFLVVICPRTDHERDGPCRVCLQVLDSAPRLHRNGTRNGRRSLWSTRAVRHARHRAWTRRIEMLRVWGAFTFA